MAGFFRELPSIVPGLIRKDVLNPKIPHHKLCSPAGWPGDAEGYQAQEDDHDDTEEEEDEEEDEWSERLRDAAKYAERGSEHACVRALRPPSFVGSSPASHPWPRVRRRRCAAVAADE